MAIQITQEQLNKIKPYAFENYVTELIIHCDKNFPHLKKTLGEEKLRQALKQGIEKAKESGFTQRGPVRFYIDMMVVFGVDFENDPQYCWIKNSLTQYQHLTQVDRTSILYDQAQSYLDKISGEKNQCLFAAAEKLNRLNLDNVPVTREHYIQNVHALLYNTYPEKYQQTNQEDITTLINQGIVKAFIDYNFNKANHVTLVILLMFLLGHEFNHDPFYAWVSLDISKKYMEHASFQNTTDVIAKKLEKRAKTWLNAAVNNEQLLLTENNKGV